MPDWQKFANLLGMAQHGDAVRATKEKKRKEGIESEELGFRRDANARAGASEARESERDTYDKGRRGSKEEADRMSLEAARFKLEDMPVQAGYAAEDQGFQRSANERAGKELTLRGEDLALRRAERAQANADRARGQARSEEDQLIQRGNVQSQYDQANNPQGAKLTKAKALEEIIATSGDTNQVEDAKEQLAFIQADLDKERVLRDVKRRTVVGR